MLPVHHSDVLPLAVANDLPDHTMPRHRGSAGTGCTRPRGGSVMPLSRVWIAHLRQTGQRHRLPYWAAMTREAEDAGILAAFVATGMLPD